MQKPSKRLLIILQKYKNNGVLEQDYCRLEAYKILFNKKLPVKTIIVLFIILLTLFGNYVLIEDYNGSGCFVTMPTDASKWFREPETCLFCENVNEITKVNNITPLIFYNNYFYTARPVVVTDGAKDWPAIKYFDFDFFKNLYKNSNYKVGKKRCQFFPYKTEFKSLDEALNMNPKRARLEYGEKPWYIGWSNCDDRIDLILKKYINTPYFLPNISESISMNWIFMGGPGYGAQMHIDNVQYPSWQAQIRGRKLWRLAPPPECYYRCSEIDITIEPGEIFVVDTNRWYHKTFILPGDISITIGSEFD